MTQKTRFNALAEWKEIDRDIPSCITKPLDGEMVGKVNDISGRLDPEGLSLDCAAMLGVLWTGLVHAEEEMDKGDVRQTIWLAMALSKLAAELSHAESEAMHVLKEHYRLLTECEDHSPPRIVASA